MTCPNFIYVDVIMCRLMQKRRDTMGFVYKTEEFNKVLEALESKYRIFAPVLKVGEGRFRDTDVIRYDYISRTSETPM